MVAGGCILCGGSVNNIHQPIRMRRRSKYAHTHNKTIHQPVTSFTQPKCVTVVWPDFILIYIYNLIWSFVREVFFRHSVKTHPQYSYLLFFPSSVFSPELPTVYSFFFLLFLLPSELGIKWMKFSWWPNFFLILLKAYSTTAWRLTFYRVSKKRQCILKNYLLHLRCVTAISE